MRRFFFLLVFLSLLRSAPADALLTPSVNVTGAWAINGSLSIDNFGCTFTGAGTVTFNQNGNNVAGNYSVTWVLSTGNIAICGGLGVQGVAASGLNGTISATRVTAVDGSGNQWNISFTSFSGQGNVNIGGVGVAGVALNLTTPSLPINTTPPPPPPVVPPAPPPVPAQCGQAGNNCALAGNSYILMTPTVYSNGGNLILGGRWTNVSLNLGGSIIPMGWYPSFTPAHLDFPANANVSDVISFMTRLADTNAKAAASTLTVSTTVAGRVLQATTTTIASSSNPSTAGASVTFTAKVTGSSPTGTVSFEDGSSSITSCSAVTLSGGSATCSTSSLSVGSHSIVAVYGGDDINAASTSSALTQTVNSTTATTATNLAGGNFLVAMPWSGTCPGSLIGWISFPDATSTSNLGAPVLKTFGGSDCHGGVPHMTLTFK